RAATGDGLLFLDEKCLPATDDWLSELAGWLAHPRVGAVCPRLVRDDGRLIGHGLAFGPDGVPRPLTPGQDEPCPGMFGDACWYRDHLAASAACLLVRRELFEQLGGVCASFSPHGAGYGLR